MQSFPHPVRLNVTGNPWVTRPLPAPVPGLTGMGTDNLGYGYLRVARVGGLALCCSWDLHWYGAASGGWRWVVVGWPAQAGPARTTNHHHRRQGPAIDNGKTVNDDNHKDNSDSDDNDKCLVATTVIIVVLTLSPSLLLSSPCLEHAHDACTTVAQVKGVGRVSWQPGLVERQVDEWRGPHGVGSGYRRETVRAPQVEMHDLKHKSKLKRGAEKVLLLVVVALLPQPPSLSPCCRYCCRCRCHCLVTATVVVVPLPLLPQVPVIATGIMQQKSVKVMLGIDRARDIDNVRDDIGKMRHAPQQTAQLVA
ncbi:hypothetical protein EDB84DRAFT_1676149 [Lactarius hengduanensis]|nr:hypothetical protein EDB84DRAFT_1676149 [Lactarius hengduanensis]